MFRAGVSNPAPGELPSCRFQLQPNQGVQGYLIITDMCVAAELELKSAGRLSRSRVGDPWFRESDL